MALTIVTAPAVEPVSVAEVKVQARITHDFEDDYIDSLIKAVRRMVESWQGVSLITREYDLFLDCFPNLIRTPFPPLQSVTSITYVDFDGNTQTVASSEYTVDPDSTGGLIYEAPDKFWPTDVRSQRKAVTVRFKAGYGDAATDVPEDIRHAIKIWVAHLYKNREVASEVSQSRIPMVLESLLGSQTFFGAVHI